MRCFVECAKPYCVVSKLLEKTEKWAGRLRSLGHLVSHPAVELGRPEDWPEVPSPRNSGKLLRKTRVWNVSFPLPHGLPAKEELFWIIQPSPAIPATQRGG